MHYLSEVSHHHNMIIWISLKCSLDIYMDTFFNPSKNRTLFYFAFNWMKANFEIYLICRKNFRSSNFPEMKVLCSDLQAAKRYSLLDCGPKEGQKVLYWWEAEHAIWKNQANVCHESLGEACYFAQWWNNYLGSVFEPSQPYRLDPGPKMSQYIAPGP